MTVNKRKLIMLAAAAVVVVLFSVGLMSNRKTGSVEVSVNNADLPITVFSSNGFEATKSEGVFELKYTEDKYTYSFVNNSGVTTDFYDLRDREQIFISFSDTREENPPISSIEQNFSGDGIELKTLRGYENDKWVIATATTPGLASDGSIGVYVLDSGAYNEIFSGTGPDMVTLIGAGIPENVAIRILEDYSALSQL